MNIQKAEKLIRDNGAVLSLVDIFKTIQGEGPFTGVPAIFIRLAGCNLQCPGCDTDYTSGRIDHDIENIVNELHYLVNPPYLVVITGGEPFRQNISPLCELLLLDGFTVQVETNGTFPPPHYLSSEVTVVCSPKTPSINKETAIRADCFKYVLNSNSVGSDGLPIRVLDHNSPPVHRPFKGDCRVVYLQPMDSKDEVQNEENVKAVVKSCLENGYVLQLQIHKLIGVE